MKYGYARTSTDDQATHLQQDALKQAGCDRVGVVQKGAILGDTFSIRAARIC